MIYLPAVLFAVVLGAMFVYAGWASSIRTFRVQESLFGFFRLYLIVYALLSVLALVRSYMRSPLQTVRSQIKWIFYGLVLGLGPFILLYQLPEVLGLRPIVSEEVSNIFFIIIPLTFAISIVRHRLMDIELVINRSLVYSILTVFTAGVFLFSLEIFRKLFSGAFQAHESVLSLGAAILAAAAFNPGRKRIQVLVDKAFFRQAFDYRQATAAFGEKAQMLADVEELLDLFLLELKNALPVEHVGVYVYSREEAGDNLLFARGAAREAPEPIASVALRSHLPLAKRNAVRMAEDVDFSSERALEERKLELAIPISFGRASYSGFVALGKKRSCQRYCAEDIGLISALANDLALHLERIKLREEVIYERASREKLDELNRLKTEFVSTVSHELRTPMSSIQGLTELLQSGKISDRAKQNEMLGVLARESGRLSRLLHNILDFGRIEQDVKTYDFRITDVRPVIQEVVSLFRDSFEARGFVLRTHLASGPVVLRIDCDAVKQALINLIDNAMKYSADRKEIDISLIEADGKVEIRIQDTGMGILPEDQRKIFEKFYRASAASRQNPKGVGLGLKIVRHIMNAHGGSVELESKEGKGSTFSLVFLKP